MGDQFLSPAGETPGKPPVVLLDQQATGADQVEGQVPSPAERELVREENEIFSLGDPPIMVSQYLAVHGRVTQQVVNTFDKYSVELTIKGSKRSKKESEWLKDYNLNHIELRAKLSTYNDWGSTFDTDNEVEEDNQSQLNREFRRGAETPNIRNTFQSTTRERSSNRRYTSPQAKPLINQPASDDPVIKLNELVVPPPKFNGKKPSPRKWLDDFERAAESNGWSDQVKSKYMPTYLRDSAYDWYLTFPRRMFGEGRIPWPDLRKAFMRHYIGGTDTQSLRRELSNTYQSSKENATQFIPRMLRLIELVEPTKPEEEIVELIKERLRGFYQDKLSLNDIYTLQQLNDACVRIEAGRESARIAEKRETKEGDKKQERKGFKDNKKDSKKYNKSERKDDNKNSKSSGKSSSKCYRCERRGHFAKECRAKSKADGSECNPKKDKKKASSVNVVQQEEPREEKPQVVVNTIRQAGQPLCVIASLNEPNNSLITKKMRCNGAEVSAIVDTGAFTSVVSAKVVKQNNWIIEACSTQLVHAAGGSLTCLGKVTIKIDLEIGKKCMSVVRSLPVIEELCADILFGVDLIREFQIVIDVCSEHPLSFARQAKGVRSASNTILPARSINLIEGKVNRENNDQIFISNFNFDRSLIVANSVCLVKDKKVDLLIANLDNVAVELKNNVEIASLETIVESSREHPTLNNVMQIGGTTEVVQVGDQLSGAQLQDLRTLFLTFKDAFSIGGVIGKTNLAEHKIELLSNSRPFAEPVRRHPRVHEDEARRQVKSMLEEGILEESQSPWASEYVMVRKKSGDWRLCIDFRRLNSLTKKNSFPLPNIESCIESLSGNQYYSKLDFASGYWQMPVAKESRELTSFRTSEGLYQFKVMPFGLTNAPASFQKLMNMMFGGLRGMHLQIFLDDICIAHADWHEHLAMLKEVLKIIIRSGLKLKGSKCIFGTSSVVFLGHRLSKEGIQQEPSKLKALRDLPPPKDASGVRRVLGGLGYYRRFVPNFAAISAPLVLLTRKNAKFQWGAKEQEAFDKLKKCLMENITLSYFDSKADTFVKTDASYAGIAGMLFQVKNGENKLVCCCSRRLSACEQNYSSTEIEGLAVVYTLQQFRPYLLGRKFKVMTDHCALCVLVKKMPQNARLRRWAIALSEFDFEICYVKGTLHNDVDCLSRAPVNDELDNTLEHVLALPLPVESWNYDDDESQTMKEKAKRKESKWQLRDEVIYYDNKLYVPTAKRLSVMREHHDSELANHDGCEATLSRMKHFYWQNMRSDVEHYVKSCKKCQLRKAERKLPTGELHSFEANRTLELVATDYIEMPRASTENNRFVVVIIDVFTKFLFARAMPDQTGVRFARVLADYCCYYGIPDNLVSDNAKSFDNAHVKQLCSELGIKHRFSAPRHHRGNAVAERAIESLLEKLALLSDDTDWEVCLPIAVMSINSRVHKTTLYEPNELMFGRSFKHLQQGVVLRQNQHDLYANSLRECVDRMRADVVASTSDAQTNSRVHFEKYNRPAQFEIGQLVVCKTSSRRQKLANRYEGPFEIVSRSDDIYNLKRVSNGEVRKRHVSQIKAFVEREGENMRVAVIATVLAFTCAAGDVILQQASPVYWRELKNKYVADSTENMQYELHYVDPCDLILSYDTYLQQQLEATEPRGGSKQNAQDMPKQSKFSNAAPPAKQQAQAQQTSRLNAQSQTPVQAQSHLQLATQQHQPPQTKMQQPPQMQPPAEPQTQHQAAAYQQVQPQQQTSNGFVMSYPQQYMQQPYQPARTAPVLHQVPAQFHQSQSANDYYASLPQTGPNPNMAMNDEYEDDSGYFTEEELAEQMAARNQAGEVYTKEDAIRLGLISNRTVRHTAGTAQTIYQKCKNVYKEEIVKTLNRFNEHEETKSKRQMQFIAGFVINDFIKAVKNRIWPESNLAERIDRAAKHINDLSKRLNMSRIMQAVDRSISQKSLNMIISLEGQTAEMPHLMLLGSYLIGRMREQKGKLEHLFYSKEQNNVDLVTISELFKTNQFGHVLGQDLKVRDISSPSAGVLLLEVAGPVRSTSTKVYEIHAISHYGNVTGQPVKAEYVGKKFLIRNSTAHCVKSIDSSLDQVVDDKCEEQNLVDSELRQWRYTPVDLSKEIRKSIAFIGWPHSIIYCWGNNISIICSGRMEVTECPTYAFRVSSNCTFNTSDNTVNHRGGSKVVSYELEKFEFDTENVHFENFRAAHKDIADSLATIDKLQKVIVQETRAASVGNLDISYKHTSLLSLCLIGSLIIAMLAMCLRRKLRNVRIIPVLWESRPTMEDTVNAAINLRLSEMQREQEERVRQEQEQLLRRAIKRQSSDRGRSNRRVVRRIPGGTITVTEVESESQLGDNRYLK